MVGAAFDVSAPVINDGAVDHWCFGCGNLNDYGLHLRFRVHGADGVWAELTPTRRHEGYLGMAHGGILATILDEAMSWAVTSKGDIGVTARMEVTFRRPARTDAALRVIGEVIQQRSRTIDTRAVIRDVESNEVLAEATGRFVRVSREQAAAWRAGYGAQPDASAFGAALERLSDNA